MTTDRNKLLELAKEAGFEFYETKREGISLVSHCYTIEHFERLAALLQAQGEQKPSGYAYRYRSVGGDVIRFNGGGEVNGSMPTEAVPYWFSPPSSDQVWNEAIEATANCCRNAAEAYERRGQHSGIGWHVAVYLEREIRYLKRPSQAQEQENCGHCQTCRPITMDDMRMVLCAECGNKRCPHANDHRNACTGSNEPGQPGSAYPASVSGAVDELPPLPKPYDYCYEWDGPYGKRKFSTASHNGRNCDRSVPLYTADQMHEYAALSRAQATQPAQQAPAVSEHAEALRIVHEEAGRTLSRADFNLCLRIAKRALLSQPAAAPIDMILHCPKCRKQHIDNEEWTDDPHDIEQGQMRTWANPPHRSHLCHGCGHIWRPADVPTNGVAEIKTKGKNDSPAAAPVSEQAVPDGLRNEVYRLLSRADAAMQEAGMVWDGPERHPVLKARDLIATPSNQSQGGDKK